MTDTSPDVERRLVETYRRMSIQEKWTRLGELFDTAKRLTAAGTRLRNSDATDRELHEDWLIRTVGRSLPATKRESSHAAR